jgi:hypothetical protein
MSLGVVPYMSAHPIDITICGERIQACNPYAHAIDEVRERKQKGDDENKDTEESELQVLQQANKLVACSDGSFGELSQ